MKLLSQKINLYVTQTSIHQGKKHKSLACNSANNHKTDQEGKILPRIQLFKTERIYLIGGFSCTHLGEAAISGHLWKHNVFSICMDYLSQMQAFYIKTFSNIGLNLSRSRFCFYHCMTKIAKCILLSCKLLIFFLIPNTILKTKNQMKLPSDNYNIH